MHAEIKVSGIVQGVGFRPFIYRTAVKNGLVGYVRNRGDAVVEIVIEGKKDNVAQFFKDLKEEKPPLAQIYNLTTNYEEDEGARDILHGCLCHLVMIGKIKPPECPLYMKKCVPEALKGACMVSIEGTCRIWAKHRVTKLR